MKLARDDERRRGCGGKLRAELGGPRMHLVEELGGLQQAHVHTSGANVHETPTTNVTLLYPQLTLALIRRVLSCSRRTCIAGLEKYKCVLATSKWRRGAASITSGS